MVSSQRKKLEGAMSKLVGASKSRGTITSHLSTFEINQPTKRIPIDKIRRSPYQPRIRLDPAHISSLAESIKASTLSNPIIVRIIGDDEYELIAGENRLEAIKSIGETEVLAVVRRVDDRTAWILSIADNVARKDLTDYEQGIAFQRMLDAEVIGNIKEMAEHLGVNRTHVHSCLAFSILPPAVHEILSETPSLIGARLALDLKEYCLEDRHADVLEAVQLIRDKKLTQSNAANWIKKKTATHTEINISLNKNNEWHSANGKVQSVVRERKDGISCKLRFNVNEISSAAIQEAIQQAIDSIDVSHK